MQARHVDVESFSRHVLGDVKAVAAGGWFAAVMHRQLDLRSLMGRWSAR